jgi:hypothetical protein
VTVIRDYLGHASIATTSRYLTVNLRLKREAMQAFWKSGVLSASLRNHTESCGICSQVELSTPMRECCADYTVAT